MGLQWYCIPLIMQERLNQPIQQRSKAWKTDGDVLCEFLGYTPQDTPDDPLPHTNGRKPSATSENHHGESAIPQTDKSND